MNVALTRARSSLFILGHAPTLERSDVTWAQIVQDARFRSALQNVIRRPFFICRSFNQVLQVDARYFASGAKTTTSLATSKKLVADSQLITPPVTLPPILTPQALKATVDAKAASAASTTLSQGRDSITASNTEAAKGTKRPGETDRTDDFSARPSTSQLPRKRQKQQTMFIPSKKRT